MELQLDVDLDARPAPDQSLPELIGAAALVSQCSLREGVIARALRSSPYWSKAGPAPLDLGINEHVAAPSSIRHHHASNSHRTTNHKRGEQ